MIRPEGAGVLEGMSTSAFLRRLPSPSLAVLVLAAGCYSEPTDGGAVETLTEGADEDATTGADGADDGASAPGQSAGDGASAADGDGGVDGDDSGHGDDGPDPDSTTTGVDDPSGSDTGDDPTTGGSDDGEATTTDEPPEDTSRVVFLLPSVGAPMTYGGVAGADGLCQAAADEAGLSGTFAAWLSHGAATGPAVRFSHEGGPFVRLDGVEIAADWADLTDGEIAAPIVVDANGVEWSGDAQPESVVITHTNADGSSAGGITPCQNFTGPSIVGPRWADAGQTDATWTENNDSWDCESDTLGGPSLYCFQQ